MRAQRPPALRELGGTAADVAARLSDVVGPALGALAPVLRAVQARVLVVSAEGRVLLDSEAPDGGEQTDVAERLRLRPEARRLLVDALRTVPPAEAGPRRLLLAVEDAGDALECLLSPLTTGSDEASTVLEVRPAAADAASTVGRGWSVFDLSPSLVGIVRGPDHVVEYANARFREVLGPDREVVGRPIRDALPELVEQGFVELLDDVLARGETINASEAVALLDRDGDGILEEAVFNYTYQPIPGPLGTNDGVFVHAVEITELVRARRRLEEEQELLRTVVQGMPAGVIIAEAGTGRMVVSNRQAAEILGVDFSLAQSVDAYGSYHGFDSSGRPIEADGWPLARAILRGEEVREEEIEYVRGDGSRLVLSNSAAPIRDERGEIVAAVVVFTDVSDRRRLLEAEQEARREAERAVARTQRLQAVTAALAEALTPEEVAGVAVRQGIAALNARAGVFAVVEEGGRSLRVTTAEGYRDEVVESWRQVPYENGPPLAQAAEAGELVVIESDRVRRERYPTLGPALSGDEGLLALPLIGDEGRVIGALGLSFAGGVEVDEEDRALIVALARSCAQALQRAYLFLAERQARKTEEAARERLAFLTEASGILAASLERGETLARVARLALRRIADSCVVEVVEPEGGEPTAVAAFSDERRHSAFLELRRRFPVELEALTGSAKVRRSGRPDVRLEISEAHLRELAADDEELLALLRALGPRASLCVPLVARGLVLGTLSLTYHDSDTAFGPDDLALAHDLARRIGLYLENARLYEHEHRVAETLQRSLLPAELPDVPGLEVAARYAAGGPGVEVGGDWYDVFELPGGRIGFALGDVVGRGITAASIMGQVRNALRAYALDGHPPIGVLERLDRLAQRFEHNQMVTLTYAVFDPVAGTLVFASAGHLPPLLRDPVAGAAYLEGGHSIPIGVLPGAVFVERQATLAPGATVLLYTDGLVERRGEPIDAGLDRLRARVESGPEEPEALCDHVFEGLVGHDARDDVALLAVRRVAGIERRPEPSA